MTLNGKSESHLDASRSVPMFCVHVLSIIFLVSHMTVSRIVFHETDVKLNRIGLLLTSVTSLSVMSLKLPRVPGHSWQSEHTMLTLKNHAELQHQVSAIEENKVAERVMSNA